MGNTCTLRLVVIGTNVNQFLVLYITNSTLVPEAICCFYKPLRTAVFIKAVRYICIVTFVHKTSILFELYGHMYCYYNVLPEAIFVVYW